MKLNGLSFGVRDVVIAAAVVFAAGVTVQSFKTDLHGASQRQRQMLVRQTALEQQQIEQARHSDVIDSLLREVIARLDRVERKLKTVPKAVRIKGTLDGQLVPVKEAPPAKPKIYGRP